MMPTQAGKWGSLEQAGGRRRHQGFFRDHFRIKGEEAARACVETIENLGAIGVEAAVA